MEWFLNFYSFTILLAIGILASILFYIVRHCDMMLARSHLWMIVPALGWMIFWFFELWVRDLALKALMNQIRFSFVAFVAFGAVVFVLAYTGHHNLVRPAVLVPLATIPLITVILTWTNPLHQLLWQEYPVMSVGMWLIPLRVYGDWFGVHMLYSYLLLAVVYLMLTHAMLSYQNAYRGQGWLLMLVFLGLHITDLFTFIHPFSQFHVTMAPFGYVFAGAILAWILSQYHRFTLTPVAQETLIQRLPDGVLVLDRTSQLVQANPSALRMLGKPLKQMIGSSLDVILPSLKLNVTMDGEHDVDNIELIHEVEGQKRHYEVQITNVAHQNDPFNGLILVLRDITERRQAERTLRKFQRAVEQSPASVVITDTSGAIEYVNPKFTRVTGYTFEEARGQSPRILKTPYTPTETHVDLWQTLLAGRAWEGEFCNHRKDGSLYWESASISPIFDSHGNITNFVAVKLESTERKQAEEALREARDAAETANRAKSLLLANMSHELRTPLNAILGFTKLLQQAPNLSPDQQHDLAIVHRSGEHLLALINDVLDLSKIEAGRMQIHQSEVHLSHMLEELHDMFALRARQKGLDFAFEYSADLPKMVRLDEIKLRQILINLLSNAIKFTQHGSVTLQIHSSPFKPGAPQETIRTLHKSTEETCCVLTFAIEDTGPGLSPEELISIFAPFVQAKAGHKAQEGSGLGLAISRHYAQLMGGDLTVTSTVGQGAIFTCSITAEQCSALAIPQQSANQRVIGLHPGQPDYRILIVDNQNTNRRLLVRMLAPLGFQVSEAESGYAALRIWQAWNPHVIFLTMNLPDIDGFAITRQIKTLPGTNTTIVGFTSSISEEDQHALLAAGCDEVIKIPLHEHTILRLLQKHTGVKYQTIKSEPGTTPLGNRALWVDHSLLTPTQSIPRTLLHQLRDAIVMGDLSAINALATQIKPFEASIAQQIEAMAYEFAYDELISLLDALTPTDY
ncbi:PAS domain S-box protein [Candidatus Chloroploca sp. Khr17]|uniref:PAS domain S-box protein n=1 Tax=Candidatus Chloroploca sp. Khr17 TaxID=2496869 RepID=UPI0013ECEA89|nr:PAS domain S-box protein [Candidatus Chloroploca sp. Khr17]